MVVFHNQTVYVFGTNSKGRDPEPMLEGKNTLEVFHKIWDIIGEDNSVDKYADFHFVYYNEGEQEPFRTVVWNKKRIENELRLNRLDEESEYGTVLPKNGIFVQTDKNTRDSRQLEEEELRKNRRKVS